MKINKTSKFRSFYLWILWNIHHSFDDDIGTFYPHVCVHPFLTSLFLFPCIVRKPLVVPPIMASHDIDSRAPLETVTSTEKAGISHVEEQNVIDDFSQAKVDGYVSYGLAKSRFDNLTIPQTIWTFKRVIIIIISVYTGYICEGFELNSSGSVIANAGFIKQFGSGDETGVRSLSTTWGRFTRLISGSLFSLHKY